MNKKNKIIPGLILFFFCLLMISGIFTGCEQKVSKLEIWEFTTQYVFKQLKEGGKNMIEFPEKYEDSISDKGENSYEIKSYAITGTSECCGDFIRQDFTLVVNYKGGNYTVSSFTIED